ncbi:protein of unassigned function [Methylobacterium oryzae CBMB20]|uniref:Protein of unassigned function n=1 Tax=Methylobacterium oryzae CBMB20 TaxID=693986 RepID=A0A089NPD9_9HYPH|nr:protein of unassigned function [Methylobacterium oryzae CBMB20]
MLRRCRPRRPAEPPAFRASRLYPPDKVGRAIHEADALGAVRTGIHPHKRHRQAPAQAFRTKVTGRSDVK